LHIYNCGCRKEEFLEITPTLAKALRSDRRPGQSLRGLAYRFFRGRGDKSGLRCEFIHDGDLNKDLPKERTPLLTLRTLWGQNNVIITDDGGNRLAFPNQVA
jgi:hypothetical protein